MSNQLFGNESAHPSPSRGDTLHIPSEFEQRLEQRRRNEMLDPSRFERRGLVNEVRALHQERVQDPERDSRREVVRGMIEYMSTAGAYTAQMRQDELTGTHGQLVEPTASINEQPQSMGQTPGEVIDEWYADAA